MRTHRGPSLRNVCAAALGKSLHSYLTSAQQFCNDDLKIQRRSNKCILICDIYSTMKDGSQKFCQFDCNISFIAKSVSPCAGVNWGAKLPARLEAMGAQPCLVFEPDHVTMSIQIMSPTTGFESNQLNIFWFCLEASLFAL